jgi:hypothetical protein
MKCSMWLHTCLALQLANPLLCASAHHQSPAGQVAGITFDPSGKPLQHAEVILHNVDDNSERTAVSNDNGAFAMEGVAPGRYTLTSTKQGFVSSSIAAVHVSSGETIHANVTLQPANPPVQASSSESSGGFFRRLANAYIQDWKGTASSGPARSFRGDTAPEESPPYRFTVWRMEDL